MIKPFVKFASPSLSKSGKTKIWRVSGAYDTKVGEVRWYSSWRRYVFCPSRDSYFDEACLLKIAEFCAATTVEQKQTWKKRRAE